MAASVLKVSKFATRRFSLNFKVNSAPNHLTRLLTRGFIPPQCKSVLKAREVAPIAIGSVVIGNSCGLTRLSQWAGRSHRAYVTDTTHNCWKCNIVLNNITEQYFCRCGVIQPSRSDRTLFEVIDMESTFDIDTKKLSNQFRKLQSLLHPDKFSQGSDSEKEYSEGQSALVNQAYSTLLKPLSRGLYLLELYGDPIEESEIQVESDFLMTIMEINEELNETTTPERLRMIATANTDMIDSLVKSLSIAFRQKNIPEAKVILTKLKYYTNIEDKVKQKQNILAGLV